MVRREQARGYQVNGLSNYLRHAIAAGGALVISGFLWINSLAVQAHEVHSVIGILA
jgi:hypothetical protein